jgi:hypothetical protein
MDSGTPRNLADYERFSGTNVNSRHISAAVMMRRSLTGEGRKRTNQANHDYVLKHFDALDFAVKALPSKRGIASAPVIAVFARAWYTQDRAKLNEAAEVLNTGVSTHPLHGVLIRHRDYCIGEGSRRISAGFGRQDLYARTERALVAFLEGQQLVKIYPVSKECFLLPEEMNE